MKINHSAGLNLPRCCLETLAEIDHRSQLVKHASRIIGIAAAASGKAAKHANPGVKGVSSSMNALIDLVILAQTKGEISFKRAVECLPNLANSVSTKQAKEEIVLHTAEPKLRQFWTLMVQILEVRRIAC